jgi:hypothetical protein
MAPRKLWQAWDESLLNMPEYDPMAIDTQPYTEQLQQLSPVLFSSCVDVEVIESSTPSGNVKSIALRDEAGLKSLFSKTPVPQLRIVCVDLLGLQMYALIETAVPYRRIILCRPSTSMKIQCAKSSDATKSRPDS